MDYLDVKYFFRKLYEIKGEYYNRRKYGSNPEQSKKYFEEKIEQKNPIGYYGLAIYYKNSLNLEKKSEYEMISNKLFKQGYPEIERKATTQKDVLCCYLLGNYYFLGLGNVNRDYQKAYVYFEMASKGGIEQATYNLGIMYLNGFGVQKDEEKANSLFSKAADNIPDALIMQSYLYLMGIGVKQDIDKSIALMKISVSQIPQKGYAGLFYIAEYLSKKYNDKEHSDLAIELYIMVARENWQWIAPEKLYEIGNTLEQKEMNQNYSQMILLAYISAAKHLYRPALIKLSALYYEGKYVKKDVFQSIYYLNILNIFSPSNPEYAKILDKYLMEYEEGKNET